MMRLKINIYINEDELSKTSVIKIDKVEFDHKKGHIIVEEAFSNNVYSCIATRTQAESMMNSLLIGYADAKDLKWYEENRRLLHGKYTRTNEIADSYLTTPAPTRVPKSKS